MTDRAKVKVLVLWEEEIRVAAQALEQLDGLLKANDDKLTEEVLAGIQDALIACDAALLGAQDESAALVLSRRPVPKRRKAATTATEVTV